MLKDQEKSKWNEILSHHDELAGQSPEHDIIKCVCIDGYEADDPEGDEEKPGNVIAKVILTKQGDRGVIYIDTIARSDKYAQEVITMALRNIENI